MEYFLIYKYVFRLHQVPIKSKEEFEEKSCLRGEMDAVYSKDQVILAWKERFPTIIIFYFQVIAQDNAYMILCTLKSF